MHLRFLISDEQVSLRPYQPPARHSNLQHVRSWDPHCDRPPRVSPAARPAPTELLLCLIRPRPRTCLAKMVVERVPSVETRVTPKSLLCVSTLCPQQPRASKHIMPHPLRDTKKFLPPGCTHASSEGRPIPCTHPSGIRDSACRCRVLLLSTERVGQDGDRACALGGDGPLCEQRD